MKISCLIAPVVLAVCATLPASCVRFELSDDPIVHAKDAVIVHFYKKEMETGTIRELFKVVKTTMQAVGHYRVHELNILFSNRKNGKTDDCMISFMQDMMSEDKNFQTADVICHTVE